MAYPPVKSDTLPATLNYVKCCISGKKVYKDKIIKRLKPFTVLCYTYFINKLLNFVEVVLKSKYGFKNIHPVIKVIFIPY
jgi:hypothetical protein